MKTEKVIINQNTNILAILVVCLSILHCSLFLSGYRLTADDVLYQYHVMNGISDSWKFIKDAAIGQGRIVHFIDLIFALLGSYYADNKIFRIFYVSIYFVNFALIAKFTSVLSGIRSGLFIALVLFSLHPLDYYHLSPNSYPLKISIPILLITISRFALWNSRKADGHYSNTSNISDFLWLILCFTGMMFSEYAFTFAVALMSTEFMTRVIKRWATNGQWRESLTHWLCHHYTYKDIALISIFIVIYFGFRIIFQSSYDGNQIAKEFNFFIFLKTLLGHIYGGTSLASFFRFKSYSSGLFEGLGYTKWMSFIFVFIGTFVASVIALDPLAKVKGAIKIAQKNLVVGALALFGAMLVTTPVALSAKYQDWCVDINTCIFLDSSLSYLGTGVFLSAIILSLAAYSRMNFTANLAVTLLLSAALAVSSSFTFLNNLRVESSMKQYVSGWERATKLACASNKTLLEIESILPKIIEPVPRISFHPDFDIKTYWLKYIAHQKQHEKCAVDPLQLTDLYPSYKVGERMLLNQTGAGLAFLSNGWASPETWGTWSEGDSAQIIFPVWGTVHSILMEARALVTPMNPKQNITIKINDIQLPTISLSSPSANMIDISIPDAIQEKISDLGLLRIQFQFPDAVSPESIGINKDNRKLSLGLQAITVK